MRALLLLPGRPLRAPLDRLARSSEAGKLASAANAGLLPPVIASPQGDGKITPLTLRSWAALIMSPRKRTTDADRIALRKRLVKYAVSDEDRFVKVPTSLLVKILPLLDRARKTRGRQPLSGRERVQENTVILLARNRKAELIATGMPRGKAADEAAEWASAQLRKTRNLSATTIKRRMQQRRH
jgi:hypothetical protein